MKISTETINIIKNFATIHQSLVVPGGNVLSTQAADQTVIAIAKTPETFPVEAMIYNTPQWLAMVSLLSDPDFKWNESDVVIKSENGPKVSWRYGSRALLGDRLPPVTFSQMDKISEFNLPWELLNSTLRAAAVLQHDAIVLTHSVEHGLVLSTTDPNRVAGQPSDTEYSRVISEKLSDEEWSFEYATARINVIPVDYTASISRKGGIELETVDKQYDITYRIGQNAKRSR